MAGQAKRTSSSSKAAKVTTTAKSRKAANQSSTAKAKSAKKPAARKAATKAPAKKAVAKKAVTKRVVAKKPALKKPAAKKTAAKKASPKATTTRRAAPKPAPQKRPSSTQQSSQKRSDSSSHNPFGSIFNSTESFFDFQPNTQNMETIMAQGKNQFDKLTQDATNASRENIEACIKSGNIWMKGCEDIMRTAMSLAQSSAEKQSKFIKQALSSKTLNEWADIQNKIAQSNFDDFMSGATRISELSVKLLTEAVEPVNNQASKTIQKASQAVAA